MTIENPYAIASYNKTTSMKGHNSKNQWIEWAAANSTYKKLAVQWLKETLCFVSSSVVADSFRLRNRQLLAAASR
jgi:hypothetical protein